MIPLLECLQFYKHGIQRVTGSNICAGEGDVDSCEGDSGGPLMWAKQDQNTGHKVYYLVGIVSGGISCASEKYPGIYVRVTDFLEWIDDNVN